MLKTMQDHQAREIDDSQITAKDFCVELRGLPPHDNVREFKAALWHWIETINEKAPDELDPISGLSD